MHLLNFFYVEKCMLKVHTFCFKKGVWGRACLGLAEKIFCLYKYQGGVCEGILIKKS